MHPRYPLALVAVSLTAGLLTAQWNPLSVEQGQIISSTTDAGAIYAVSQNNGVFKSTNDGATWTAANSGLPTPLQVRSAGAAGSFLFAGTTTGVYRSNNAGASWTNINGSLTANADVHVQKWYTFGNTVLAVFTGSIANGGGIARTTNNGNTWLMGHSGMSSNLTVNNITSNGSTLFAATNIGLFRSDDMAANWTAVATTNFALHAVEWIENRLVCIVANGNYRYSTNEGGSWTASTGSPTNAPKGELMAFQGVVYAVTGTVSGCMRSTDNGTSFEPYNTGLIGFDVYGQYKFHRAETRIYMGTEGDLYRIDGIGTALTDAVTAAIPAPYPTAFDQQFHMDLSSRSGPMTLVLFDGMGREVMRYAGLPNTLATLPRNGLASGRYFCALIDPHTGMMQHAGTVIAQ